MPSIEVLVVGAGGAGGTSGANVGGGGGGAGGYLYKSSYFVDFIDYAVTVGQKVAGGKGENSVFGTMTSYGGGLGSSWGGTTNINGGSGGGRVGNGAGGTGTSGQGYNGGSSNGTVGGDQIAGAGGGGSSSAGGNVTSRGGGIAGGNGGNGTTNLISGVSVVYSKGGAGGASNGFGARVGVDGDTPGSGGSGCDGDSSGGIGQGANGIVIIRYKTSDFGYCEGGTKTVNGDYTIHIFTTNGTITFRTLPVNYLRDRNRSRWDFN